MNGAFFAQLWNPQLSPQSMALDAEIRRVNQQKRINQTFVVNMQELSDGQSLSALLSVKNVCLSSHIYLITDSTLIAPTASANCSRECHSSIGSQERLLGNCLCSLYVYVIRFATIPIYWIITVGLTLAAESKCESLLPSSAAKFVNDHSWERDRGSRNSSLSSRSTLNSAPDTSQSRPSVFHPPTAFRPITTVAPTEFQFGFVCFFPHIVLTGN